MKKTKMNKREQAFIDALNNSEFVTLNDVYGTFSTNKEKAWNECYKKFQNGNNARHFRIISYNTFEFSCGWYEENEHGNQIAHIETANNTYIFRTFND